MESILLAIENAIKNENWYAALFICLTVPDICSSLETPSSKSRKRYVNWFKKYLNNKYKGYLSGDDCYSLRCSYFHEGTNVIEHQSAREILDKFVFLPRGSHCNLISNCNFDGDVDDRKNILQLSVEAFCEDMIEAARKWLIDVRSKQEIQERISKMLKIEDKINIGSGAIIIREE